MVENLDIPTQGAYVVFPGRNVEQMPLLIKQGRTPMTIYEFAKQKLLIRDLYNAVNKNPDNYAEELRQKVQDAYKKLWDKHANTGDLWLRQSAKQDGKGKIVLYNEQVLDFLKKNLNPKSILVSGALALDGELEGVYNSFTGNNVLELTKDEVDNFFGKPHTKQGAKENPFWTSALGDLKDDYIDVVFADGKQRFDYDENMGVYVRRDAQNVPTLRSWLVDRLEGGSGADGRYGLLNDDGRLVGVAPEARAERGSKASEPLEAKILRDLRAGKAVVDGNRIYAHINADNLGLSR